LPSSIYDAFFPGADPLSFAGDVNSWEEKWGVSSSSASQLLKLINDKWATVAKWKKGETRNAADDASMVSYWKLTDEKGQVWNGIVSLQPVATEKNRFLLTLKIARADASAQLK
jgi:hypothetical protein